MNDQFHLSDRMPAVAAGTTRWSSAEQQHLAGCADCRAEWALVSEAAALGCDIERSLEVTAIERGVLAGLAEKSGPARRTGWAWLVPIAAAAGLIVVLQTRSVEPDPVESAEVSLLPELETLTSAQLESVMTLLPAGTEVELNPDGFEDLSESEVLMVLKDLEG